MCLHLHMNITEWTQQVSCMYPCVHTYVCVTKKVKTRDYEWGDRREKEEKDGGDYVNTVLMQEILKKIKIYNKNKVIKPNQIMIDFKGD